MKKLWVIPVLLLLTSCLPFETSNNSCYRIKDGKVYLRYYGGYPRPKEVMLKVEGADAKSFKFIENSREGACQGGDMFAKDEKHVFYRNEIIKMANPESFEVLNYGYSKDEGYVFYRTSFIPKVDPESFFVIENDRKRAYSADKYGLIVRNKRIGGQIDANSFELLFRPYSKDKNHVYYSDKFHVLEGADPTTFTCPKFESIVNYQYYAYDRNKAYFYEGQEVEVIENIDYKTFKVLSPYYAKDKYSAYYKAKVIQEADPASFQVPDRVNKRSARDKNHSYFQGEIKDK
jgi:hypothetical protein